MNCYNNKKYLKIISYERLSIIGNCNFPSGSHFVVNMVDLDNVMGNNDFSNMDTYQMEIFYYGFIIKYFPMLGFSIFNEFIKNGNLSSYPEIENPSVSFVNKQIELQHQLYHSNFTGVDKLFDISLTGSTMIVDSYKKDPIINSRALFDDIQCDEKIIMVKYYGIKDNKHFVVKKKYKLFEDDIKVELIKPSMYIVFRLDKQFINLHIYPNGVYKICAKWKEASKYGYEKVKEFINLIITPFITKINTQSKYFNNVHIKLPIINKYNSRFADVGFVLNWNQSLTHQNFKNLKKILDEFNDGGILKRKQIDESIVQYYFKKNYIGDVRRIEQELEISNYYSHHYDNVIKTLWLKYFENIITLTITHKYSNIRIELCGLKDKEFKIFVDYFKLIILKYNNLKQDTKIVKQEGYDRKKNKLAILKQIDPELYKVKSSIVKYSKVCQKPFQPDLVLGHTGPVYDNKKNTVVEFWNYTTNTPLHYQCNDKRYPYLGFITGKHPENFCIPCCKKIPSTTEKSKLEYSECMLNHIFTKDKLEEQSSRYVTKYGKYLDAGRLSKLPESSIEPLLHKSIHVASDKNTNYYLYGIPQNIKGKSNVGYIQCLANALNMTIDNLIGDLCKKINQDKSLFNLLLGGNVKEIFEDVDELMSAITNLLSNSLVEDIDWNMLFIDIGKYYYNITTVLFKDNDTIIKLHIPDFIKSYSNYFNINHKYLFVIYNVNHKTWNNIYLLNTIIYFKTEMIEKKLFEYNSELVQSISEIIKFKFTRGEIYDHFDFEALNDFLIDGLSEITNIYTDKNNLCYGVDIKNVGYIPMKLSYVKLPSDKYKLILNNDINIPSIMTLRKFINKWNSWVIHKSLIKGNIKKNTNLSEVFNEQIKSVYPLINPVEYLSYKNKFIGFTSHGLNFYFKHVTNIPKYMPDAKIIKLNYDPIKINTIISKTKPSSIDVSQIQFKYIRYQLILLKLSILFNSQKNTKMRKIILNLYKKNIRSGKFLNLVRSLELHENDMKKIEYCLCISHNYKLTFPDIFEDNSYEFDNILLKKLKSMSYDNILNNLTTILKKHIVKIVKVDKTSIKIDNILINNTQIKIPITTNLLNKYAKIITQQIQNPFYKDYIFSSISDNYFLDYFKFKKYPNETISIRFI